jgi:hypothetical protein
VRLDELQRKVREWDISNGKGSPMADAFYLSILSKIEYFAESEWRVYLPAEHPDFSSNYMERLAKWIGNVSDEEDQKLLLEYALQISFFSHEDFVALYQTALAREVFPWIASQLKVKLNSKLPQSFQAQVRTNAFRHTWFCPVTDSMDINEFYKVNHIEGISHRPGFSALHMMDTSTRKSLEIADIWNSYMKNPNNDPTSPAPELKYLVLMEDIVGSGSQCSEAVKWAVTHISAPVLFIPLILCPKGANALTKLSSNSGGKLTVRPIISLKRSDLLGTERKGQLGWEASEKMEDFAQRHKIIASYNKNEFGYESTGCSIATFSNTPDNSLPLIHNKPSSGSWEPLFPRVYRD